jgi:HlyD family secretion protein
VTGIVKKLYVDYNSIVAKGQLIAEMDPSTIEVQVESAEASLDRAAIDLDELQNTLRVDEANRDREEQLFAQHLATQQEREQGELQVKEDEALIKQDAAAVSVARDNVKQAQVNLSYCTIRSPVDGVVVTRNADEGQTVTASVSVPSLFIIATDVRTLDLLALVDESDIGKLHPDQDVIFTVSAYPNRQFHGVLDHVRLNSVNSNNVISYQAVSTVANPDLRLMPSMTASVKVQIAHADDVVRVPNTALRFKPTAEMFKAFDQPVPAETAAPPVAAPAPVAVAPPAAAAVSTAPTSAAAGTMIDRRFKSLPRQSSTGQVWVFEDHRLRSVPLQLGITDGTWTELDGGAVQAGDQLVASVSLPARKK